MQMSVLMKNVYNYWFGQSNILMNEIKRYIAKQAYCKYTDIASFSIL